MNKGLSYGLNLAKRPGPSKPGPPKRKPIFGDDDLSDDESAPKSRSDAQGVDAEEILELDGFAAPSRSTAPNKKDGAPKQKNGAPPPPLRQPKKPQITQAGDLSSALASRKYAEAAEALDPSIYDYDGVYDSLKAAGRNKPAEEEGSAERRPKYMSSLAAAAAVRKRDALAAEDKRIAREREAEGDEYAGKEKFVTEAYLRQQEENRRLEEEERRREEDEARKNKSGGMTGFYKSLLEKGDRRHAEMMKAAEERTKGGGGGSAAEETEEEKAKTEADIAREINEKGGAVVINEDGQVVDKRQLLRGGLNVGAKKKTDVQRDRTENKASSSHRDQGRGFVGAGGKQGMRERQTRMLEEQLEQALKRSRDEEEEERKKVELASKTRKTESDISSARERYLARKKAAEEEKKRGLENQA